MTLAAERLVNWADSNPVLAFDYASNAFASTLRYQWGCATYISKLWNIFRKLVEVAAPDQAVEFAKQYASAFRWVVAGHVHRLNLEYEQRPEAILAVEFWRKKKERFLVGVQRDGNRRMMPPDRTPENPMIAFAGTKMPHFIAPSDFKTIKKMGSKRFLAALESGN